MMSMYFGYRLEKLQRFTRFLLYDSEFCGHWVCEYDSPAGIMGWEQDARRGKDEHDELTEEGATSGENIAAENGKIMTFALHELRNAIHALDASASYIGEVRFLYLDAWELFVSFLWFLLLCLLLAVQLFSMSFCCCCS